VIPAAYAGVWAAEQTPPPLVRYIPVSPFAEPAHYFLVVSSGPDGTFRAFIRNPEFNAGTVFGSKSDLPALNVDGTITLSHVSPNDGPLTFHRAGSAELSWYYPRPTADWVYHPPQDLHDGWPVADLGDAGMKLEPIAAYMRAITELRAPNLRSPDIQSVSIERHGKLVIDEYFYGFTPQQPHDTRSAGKSVTTLMVGRAIEDTHAFTSQSRVLPLLPQYAPVTHLDARKQRMTVADLMTMASGLACDDNDDNSPGNEDTMQSQPAGTDWYRYTLDLPMVTEPGSRAVYCTAGINLLGAIVRTTTRMPLTTYFADRFATPLQFGTYAMWLMPAPVNEAYMGGGDYFRPRDFLKFGALLLDNGRWNGTQILDPSWIASSLVPRTAPVGEGDHYGYGWHLSTVTVDGTPYDVINAGGNGGQLMIVIPKLDVAIMLTAGNYNQYPVWRQFLPDIVTAVVRSCRTPRKEQDRRDKAQDLRDHVEDPR
jgi:CubicO group peptidase (beta-lactamase class C family)